MNLVSCGSFVQDPQTSEILGTEHKVGRLFELKSLRIPFKVITAAIISSIWHARLGHPSDSRLGSLIFSGCLGPITQEHVDCISCQLSIQHAFPWVVHVDCVTC